jgi:UV DNA damage endonuclease
MDLMIEAKDKEQAVFELMRTFRLPGWDLFNDVVPYEREDESRKAVKKKKKPAKKTKVLKATASTNGEQSNGAGAQGEIEQENDIETPEKIVDPEDYGMGGPERRVYWPEGMEEWLKPKKRESNKKAPAPATPVRKKRESVKEEDNDFDEDN